MDQIPPTDRSPASEWMHRNWEQMIAEVIQDQPLEKWLPFPKIAAVSGGADSVLLLRMLADLQSRSISSAPAGPLFVAHVNHRQRGAESDADEAFVAKLARQMKLEFFFHRSPDSVPPNEEDLRNERYNFFRKLAYQTGARVIAMGHHADDQIETILFRIFRGTGIGGLAGIPPISPVDETVSIVRPLLNFRRFEIEFVLNTLQQPYRTDGSNQEVNFTRNYLRLELLPRVYERFGPQVATNLLRLGRQAWEHENFLNSLIEELHFTIRAHSVDEIELDRVNLSSRPVILLRQFFRRIWKNQNWPLQSMTAEKWQDLAQRALSPVPSVIELPGRIRCEFTENRIRFIRRPEA
jgi:tRNA(Ile)-lysidine synthase